MATLHDIDRKAGAGLGAGHVARPLFGLRRPAINITPVERLGRVAIGLLAMAAGALLLAGAGSVPAVVLEVLLVLAGVDLAVTGALGHCPLYHKLGYVPASLRRSL
jgi:hypothetical protein